MDSIVSLEHVVWVVIWAGVIFVLPKMVASRITSSVQHEYNELLESIKLSHQRQLEKEKNSREVRLKSAIIAELLAEWTSRPDNKSRLRQLTYEAFLWLPPSLAKELSAILSHEDAALSIQDFLIKVRKLLLGDTDDLTADKVISFQLSQFEQMQKSINNPFGQ
ncbi:Uncharacterised protein [Serratia fonticola]|uniref:Uncharacterized protein n=1 Tax=Serratia fonticola TaxID=47917 RepID=A0A3S5AZK5_SERFO|nr:hypothetical protein [Serratia fonticola]CAI1822145.1 Uncharacterised protein [Serratia fonticola]VEI69489.1 Uncharacterised protein [Serratia fonticola]